MPPSVVITKHPLATEVGLSVLEEGGNAWDAVVAIGFTLAVVQPHMSGLGGGAFQLVYREKDGSSGVIESPITAPSGAREDIYKVKEGEKAGIWGFPGVEERANEVGQRSVAIPGVVAGLCASHEIGGRLPLASLIAPAIKFAEQGFNLGWSDMVYLFQAVATGIFDEEAMRVFTSNFADLTLDIQVAPENPNCLIQSDLAGTLRMIANNGRSGFYDGRVAAAIVAATGGNWISTNDLRSFGGHHSSATIRKIGDWALITGPDFTLLQTLELLHAKEIYKRGHNSAEYVDLACKCIGITQHEFRKNLGSRGAPVTIDEMLDPAYLRRLSDSIRMPLPGPSETLPSGHGHTTGFSVLDSGGTIITVLQTHGYLFGSGIVAPDTGVLLNNQMLGFNPIPGTATSAAPGQTRPIPGWPVVGYRSSDGALFGISCPGGNRTVSAMIQVALNVSVFGMEMREALTAPRFDVGSIPGSPNTILIDKKLIRVGKELARRGRNVVTVARAADQPGGSPTAFAEPGGLSLIGGSVSGGNDPTVTDTFQSEEDVERTVRSSDGIK